jgi:hypothetical protein
MKRIYMDAFMLGVAEELEKVSATDINSMPVNENILPSISSQAKWKYARGKDSLKLSDGNLVYSFAMPEQYPSEDTKVSRMEDDNILNFEKDSIGKGTAQIHRSSPDNIYMTLADGGDNPTFMLQHEEGKNWRYSPSKKFIEKLKKMNPVSASLPSLEKVEEPVAFNNSMLIDPESLFAGGEDHAKQASLGPEYGAFDSESAATYLKDLVSKGKGLVNSYVDYNAAHPVTSTLGRYAVLKGIDAARGAINPDREFERIVDPKVRTRRELFPIAAAALPTIASLAMKAE